MVLLCISLLIYTVTVGALHCNPNGGTGVLLQKYADVESCVLLLIVSQWGWPVQLRRHCRVSF